MLASKVLILSSDNQNKWLPLKQQLYLSALKLSQAKHNVFAESYDHDRVMSFIETLEEGTSLLILDHTNVNIQCILSQIPLINTKNIKCFFYIDDLFIETALRFDLLPFSKFSHLQGAFLYPSTSFKKVCNNFFPNSEGNVLSFPLHAQHEIFKEEQRHQWREKQDLKPQDKAIVIPLALRRDSNTLYFLKTFFEDPYYTDDQSCHFFLTMEEEEASIPFYLLSLPQGHLFQELLQVVKSQPKSWQKRIHFIDKCNEEILWGSDLLIDISTTLPHTTRPICALAQECGLTTIASSWGLCQKNILSHPFPPLFPVATKLVNKGIELDSEKLWQNFKQCFKTTPSWEQRILWAKEERKKRTQTDLTKELNEILKSQSLFGPTTWKLRYHSQNLKMLEKPLSLQSFEGHIYEYFC